MILLALVERRDDGLVGRRLHDDEGLAPSPRELCAQVIGHFARCHVDEPRARIVGDALGRPLHRRSDEGFLDGVLGGAEIAVASNDHPEHLRRQVAQQVLAGICGSDQGSTGGALITSRTSIARLSGLPPLPGAEEARAAIA